MHDTDTEEMRRPHITLTAMLMCLTGCSHAPSQNIFGSYFPSWMVCALAGLIFAVVIRHVLATFAIDKTVPAPLLVYLALAVAFTFASWLVWLS